MGGSGGGGRLTYREEQALEQIARKKFQEGAQPEKRNVFISFVKEDENEVNLLMSRATAIPQFRGHQGQMIPQFWGQMIPQFQGQMIPQFQGQMIPHFQGQIIPQSRGRMIPR